MNHSTFTYKPISKDLSTKFKTLTFNNAEVEKILSFCKKSNVTFLHHIFHFYSPLPMSTRDFVCSLLRFPDTGDVFYITCVAVNGGDSMIYLIFFMAP